jgi:hypothetical protein
MEVGMGSLTMHICAGGGNKTKDRTRPRSSLFMIVPTSQGPKVEYPSDERVLALAKKHYPLDKVIEVVKRTETHQGLVMRFPTGTTPKERQPFLDDLQKEVIFS